MQSIIKKIQAKKKARLVNRGFSCCCCCCCCLCAFISPALTLLSTSVSGPIHCHAPLLLLLPPLSTCSRLLFNKPKIALPFRFVPFSHLLPFISSCSINCFGALLLLRILITYIGYVHTVTEWSHHTITLHLSLSTAVCLPACLPRRQKIQYMVLHLKGSGI